jgi:hypothetical protein
MVLLVGVYCRLLQPAHFLSLPRHAPGAAGVAEALEGPALCEMRDLLPPELVSRPVGRATGVWVSPLAVLGSDAAPVRRLLPCRNGWRLLLLRLPFRRRRARGKPRVFRRWRWYAALGACLI